MPKVRILPPEVVKCIAAGEVIEQPSSVVKELVENSLDASASRILVEADGGGIGFLHVKDNGTGIEKEDLELCLKRHTSSKVGSVEDVFNVKTMGFRGEALYSIASVSRIEIVSKAKGRQEAWRIKSDPQSGVIGPKPASFAGEGTDILVRDLFFNMPARRKFLKGERSQYSSIVSLLVRYAVVYPDVEWVLKLGGKTKLDLKRSDLHRRAKDLFGVSENDLILIDSNFPMGAFKITLSGFSSNANVYKRNRSEQFLFVNKRPVVIPSLSFRINEAYKAVLAPRNYPIFALNIGIDPGLVDVNVHPAKQEVKFRDEAKIISVIVRAVESAIKSNARPKQMHISASNIIFPRRKSDKGTPLLYAPAAKALDEKQPDFVSSAYSEYSSDKNKPAGLFEMLREVRFLAVAMNKYILCEYKKSLLIIDVHAAAEKVNYERFIKQVSRNGIEVENFITPHIIKLSRIELAKWEETAGLLTECGFATTRWSDDEIALHSSPVVCNDPCSAVKEFFASDFKFENASFLKDRIASFACRRSLMAGDRISESEAKRLLSDLFNLEDPFSCPHGRPAVIELTDEKIERLFLRT